MHSSPGLRFKPMAGYSCYSGSAKALLSAGLLLPEQLPGSNGNPATCASFHPDGRRVQRGEPNAHTAVGYLKVQRMRNGSFRVMRCVESLSLPPPPPGKTAKYKRVAQPARTNATNWPFPVVVGALPLMEARA